MSKEGGVDAQASQMNGLDAHEQLTQRLRSELQQLRESFQNASRTHDYVDVAQKAHALCKAALDGCLQKAVKDQTAKVAAAAAEAAAAGQDPVAAATAAAGSSGPLAPDSLLALMPSTDDGTSCLLLRLPPGWSSARVQAFVERHGPKPQAISKAEGQGHALLSYGSAQDREKFTENFRQEAGKSHKFTLKLPGEPGVKRSREDADFDRSYDALAAAAAAIGAAAAAGAGDGGGFTPRHQQQQGQRGGQQQKRQKQGKHQQQHQRSGGDGGPRDIRRVVCPWWDVPYGQQLSDKMNTVTAALRSLSEQIARSYSDPSRPGPHPKPQWLLNALRRPDKVAVTLTGIVRSPQLNGYRNKAEFSVGLDAADQPIVGFLQGMYVDGHTQVVDPSGCRHMSPTSLAYAAVMTSFLRSSDNQLPPWDKRHGKGFWRLLVVREGRQASWLPLLTQQQPAAAAPTDTSSSEQQQQQQEAAAAVAVLPPCQLSEVPLERWLVNNPVVTAAAAADADTEKALADAEQPDTAAETDTAAAAADTAAAVAAGLGAFAGGGMELSQVSESEPPAPLPSQVMVMVQVNPLAAPGGPGQIKAQLQALGQVLRAAAASQHLPLTNLVVQYHSGVSNAAPAGSPLTPFPGDEAEGGAAAAADAEMVDVEGGDDGGGGAVVAPAGLGVMDALCELKFRVSPLAFYQVNAGATCLLYHTLGRFAAVGPDSLLLDVCCGTGTIGLTLAKQVAAVVGIDNVSSAIDDARVNASLNGISNATFVCGAAEKVLKSVLEEHTPRYSNVVAIVDPPRAGLHRDVLLALLCCPALKRLVFVSCNTDSLVQNAGLLCGRYRPDLNAPKVDPRRAKRQRRGHNQQAAEAPPAPLPPYTPFRPTQAVAFDLFPHTAHVEAVVLFERE